MKLFDHLATVMIAKYKAQSNNYTEFLQRLEKELNGYDQPQNLKYRFLHGYEVGNSMFELVAMCTIPQFDQQNIMTKRLSTIVSDLETLYRIPSAELQAMALEIYPKNSHMTSFNLYDGRLKLLNLPDAIPTEKIEVTFEEIKHLIERISANAKYSGWINLQQK